MSKLEKDRRLGIVAIVGYAAVLGGGILATILVWRYSMICGAALAVVIALWLRREADALSHDNPNRRATWMAISQLGIGWGAGFVISFLFLATSKDMWSNEALGDAVSHFLLVATAAGGLYAVFRSTSTQAHSQATRFELERLRGRLHRLSDLAIEAHHSSSPGAVIEKLSEMLAVAVRLPDTSKHVDAISLWIRAGDRWVILLAFPPDDERKKDYAQPVLSAEEPGAGVVANMAATATPLLIIEANADEHRWWKRFEGGRKNEGLAAVLLRNAPGEVLGAICITSERRGEIHDNEALATVLRQWGRSFTLALEALRR